ncbi:hypothetical protein BUZ05_06430 [Staphylococcus gallinarum]|uniref:hypothetical protein n=2 Tax=Staphylococcus gallinarum TaxID=1293 RepID=UPI000D1DB8B2|nr:hypothetical protein [Staphylococcus gallinarum]PTK93797.1 hypothetical protein BUZ05_06430 [Staphylococcus gallinarum]
MKEVVRDMDVGVWWSLVILISLYTIKEIIRFLVDARKNTKRIKSEMQYKYAEKLLDQKVPIYIGHYSYLKKAIGIYLHIINHYHLFENWDDEVYSNIINDKQYSAKNKDTAYRNSMGYRCCVNLSAYITKYENMKVKSINEFSLNQLFIADKLISKSLKINTLLDEKLHELVNISSEIEMQHDLSDARNLKIIIINNSRW